MRPLWSVHEREWIPQVIKVSESWALDLIFSDTETDHCREPRVHGAVSANLSKRTHKFSSSPLLLYIGHFWWIYSLRRRRTHVHRKKEMKRTQHELALEWGCCKALDACLPIHFYPLQAPNAAMQINCWKSRFYNRRMVSLAKWSQIEIQYVCMCCSLNCEWFTRRAERFNKITQTTWNYDKRGWFICWQLHFKQHCRKTLIFWDNHERSSFQKAARPLVPDREILCAHRELKCSRGRAEYYSHFLSEEQQHTHPLLKTALIKVSDFTF